MKKTLRNIIAAILIGAVSYFPMSCASVPTKANSLEEKKTSIELKVSNDNSGIQDLDRIREVDDAGYTFGSRITIKKKNITLDYSADVFTKRRNDIPMILSDDGHVFIPQNALDEILLTLTIDNKKQTSPFYYDYSFGILALGNYENFPLAASWQQKAYHLLAERAIPVNQETEDPQQFGIIFGFHGGLYLPIRFCDWANFSTDLKAGGRLSSVLHANYFDFITSTDLTFGKSFITKLNFSSDTKLHDRGIYTILSLGPSFGIKEFQVGFNVSQPFGDSLQMHIYDDKRVYVDKTRKEEYDAIIELFLRTTF